MSDLNFNLTPIMDKPSRRYRKGSKYDPIIHNFKEGNYTLATVTVEGKEANYLRTQLNKRLDALGITDIKVSVVNNVCYLEKV